MVSSKFILGLMILCSCFSSANADFDFFNDTTTVKNIDWSDYDHGWSAVMNANIEIPDDVNLVSFPGEPIDHVYLHPIQKYVLYNGTMYSDTKKPFTISGFKTGSIGYDEFYRTDIIDESNRVSCIFVCSWTDKGMVDGQVKKENKFVVKPVTTEYYNSTLWDNLTNTNVSICLSNYTKNYLLLNVCIPKQVTAYTINLTSANNTALYEKYEYIYTLNGSGELNYYDMKDVDAMKYDGIIPFGPNRFYIPFNTDYNITIDVYTPFEKKTYNYENVSVIDVIPTENDDGDWGYIFFFIGFGIAMYYIYRRI